jgi:hypothetical protein
MWLMFYCIPSLSYQKTPGVGENNENLAEIYRNTPEMLKTLAFCSWLAVLMWVSKVWRDRIDRPCVVFSKWVEEIMTDTKAFSKVSSTIEHSFRVAVKAARGKAATSVSEAFRGV